MLSVLKKWLRPPPADIFDGVDYRFREWPDDGEMYLYRAADATLVNVTNYRDDGRNDLLVHPDGRIVNRRGQHVGWTANLVPWKP